MARIGIGIGIGKGRQGSLLNLADVLAMNIDGTEYDIIFNMEGAEYYITF